MVKKKEENKTLTFLKESRKKLNLKTYFDFNFFFIILFIFNRFLREKTEL